MSDSQDFGFPLTADVNLRKSGSHHDIRYEITNHGREECGWPDLSKRVTTRGTYCYYVYIAEDMLPADQFEEFWLPPIPPDPQYSSKRVTYDYYAPKWSGAEWHGGVTWYSKEAGFDGDPRVVKIGCDFSHLWDKGRYYTLDCVDREARATIDELRRMYSFHRRDPWNGDWQPESEMVEYNGQLYSKRGAEQRKKFDDERCAEMVAS